MEIRVALVLSLLKIKKAGKLRHKNPNKKIKRIESKNRDKKFIALL